MTDEDLIKVALDHGYGPAMLAMGSGVVAGAPENFLPMLRAIERKALERVLGIVIEMNTYDAIHAIRALIPGDTQDR